MLTTCFNSILLVDDDYVNNFITERLLRKSGIAKEIKAVRNGEEALTYLSEEINYCPDLILLDINMPEMDGINFLKNFKTMVLDKNIRIVLLTSSVNVKDREMLNDLGYQDIMMKPFTQEKLMNALNKDLVKY
jgi:CheY-like chemotaxis protein